MEYNSVPYTDDILDAIQPSYQHAEAYTRFRDIEKNISVREGFNKDDYGYFRPGEVAPSQKKERIRACQKAYEKIGIIQHVIDLMSDFTCQGIKILHPQPTIEKFGRAWFNQLNGKERSERFTSLLYRQGQVIVKRETAKLSKKSEDLWKRAVAADIELDVDPIVNKREIPGRYTFISPLQVDVIGDHLANFMDRRVFKMPISKEVIRIVNKPNNEEEKELAKNLPTYILEAIAQNKTSIILDSDKTKCYYYRKDDWEVWATPMIYPILDDLIVLEKLKLTDLTALEGAISHIRIWKLGDLDKGVLPNPAAIRKLSDILMHNVGGGSMDLIWGPDITLEETKTDISNFLGAEKYQPTLTNIYGGLGIPSTLTGSNSKGGFTNNYLALRTLVEKLNYGRGILEGFWRDELAVFQRAMGIRQPFRVGFDYSLLADENSYRALLIQLVDRNIISEDTLRDKFGEISEIEQSRIKREFKGREKDYVPAKITPLNQVEHDLKKIALQNGYAPSEVGLELEHKLPGEVSLKEKMNLEKKQVADPKGVPGQGRPIGKKDSTQRERKNIRPIGTGEIMKNLMWSKAALREISEILTPIVLDVYGRKNARSMTEAEFAQAEHLKFSCLAQLEVGSPISEELIKDIVMSKPTLPVELNRAYKQIAKTLENPTIEDLRNAQCIAYSIC